MVQPTLETMMQIANKGVDFVDKEGNKQANTEGHKERIVKYDDNMLKFTASLFENTDEWESCKLVTIHSIRSLNVLKKLMNLQRVSSVTPFISEGFHATNALKDNTLSSITKYPIYDKYEMIFNSTQVGNMSPFSKLPQSKCSKESQYDNVDYTLLVPNYCIRTNYVPKTDILSFKHYIDNSEEWFNKYKICFKKMLVTDHERTLKGGIIPPKASHTHSLISVCFDNSSDLLQFAGFASSVVLDYFVKTVGVRNLTSSVIQGLPFEISEPYKLALVERVLCLNCVNDWYKSLWLDNNSSIDLQWSIMDKRLSLCNNNIAEYNTSVLLKNDFERRTAMVEIDVLVAMSIGLELSDLEFIYNSTFATTQKYEADTWYDQNGRVIFSVSGEYDLKLPRKGNTKQKIIGWEDIRGEQVDENTYRGTMPTYTHTIDSAKSELYGGQQQTFVAPYTRCDRIAVYRTAWAHFEKIFNK